MDGIDALLIDKPFHDFLRMYAKECKKRRGKDIETQRLYLTGIYTRILQLCENRGPYTNVSKRDPNIVSSASPTISDNEKPVTKEEIARIDAQNEANKSTQAEEDKQFIIACVKEAKGKPPADDGQRHVYIKATRSLGQFDEYLRAAGCPISNATLSAYPPPSPANKGVLQFHVLNFD